MSNCCFVDRDNYNSYTGKSIVLTIVFLMMSFLIDYSGVYGGGLTAHALSPGRIGLYVWTEIPTDELIDLIQTNSVSEIYYAIPGLSATPTVDDLESCDKILTECNAVGIKVWYLAGAPDWGTDATGTEIRKAIEAVAEYNNTADASFEGIQLDIEPYILEEWNTNQSLIAQDWYLALKIGKARADELGVKVMICIPYWLDTLDSSLLEDLTRDCCDDVAVMCYRRGTESEDILAEVELAAKYGKRVICVSELSAPNSTISDDNTYYTVGLNTLYENWKMVKDQCPVISFAYHHAEPLRMLLT